MIDIKRKEECCGCGACYNICPCNAVQMQSDCEGFLYPIVNGNCIECGKCINVCPIINKRPDVSFRQMGYVVQNKNEQVLRESTSGGAFSGIAEYAIENDGVVFGAAYDEELNVKHISVDNTCDLKKFRNSKYVQSEIGKTYTETKKYLNAGRIVLFSGTPCQIEGLLRFLGSPYDKLVTVDVVCRAVSSPMIFDKYKEFKKNRYNISFGNILFRDKFYGYKYSTLSIFDNKNRNIYHKGIDSDEMLRAFFSNICNRPSCYDCKFKKRYRQSDITLWDCFEPEKYYPEINNDKGTTRVLIHSDKGRKVFEETKDRFRYKVINPDDLIAGTKEMIQSVDYNSKRELFFRDANVITANNLFEKYFADTFETRFERSVRLIANRMGIYPFVRRIYKTLFGDRMR